MQQRASTTRFFYGFRVMGQFELLLYSELRKSTYFEGFVIEEHFDTCSSKLKSTTQATLGQSHLLRNPPMLSARTSRAPKNPIFRFRADDGYPEITRSARKVGFPETGHQGEVYPGSMPSLSFTA